MSIALLQAAADGLGQVGFRWIHAVAGLLLVGLTWGQEWALPDDAALRERLRFWSRWSALAAWLTGLILLFLLYYRGPYLFASGSELAGAADTELADWAPYPGLLAAGVVLYELLARLLSRAPLLLAALAVVGVERYAAYMQRSELAGRALFVHAGALLGSAMVWNVWLRIEPALRRAEADDGLGVPELVRARNRHNAYAAGPLVLCMLAVHQQALIGHEHPVLLVGLITAGGFAAVWALGRVERSLEA